MTEVTPGFLPIFENILGLLDSKDLISASKVCPEWNKVLEDKPKLWMSVINFIQRKRFLVHPNIKIIQSKIFANMEYHIYAQYLMKFDEEYAHKWPIKTEYGPFRMIDDSFVYLTVGNIERMKFFWPYLNFTNFEINSHREDFEPPPTLIWYLVDIENIEMLEYFVEKFQLPEEADLQEPMRLALKRRNYVIANIITMSLYRKDINVFLNSCSFPQKYLDTMTLKKSLEAKGNVDSMKNS